MAVVMRLSIVLSIALLLSAILTCSEDGPTIPVVPMDTAFGVVSVSPIPGASDVPVDAAITLTFSMPVRSTTVSPSSIVLEPSVGYTIECPAASLTVTIWPTNGLAYEEEYTIRVLPSVISIYEDTLVGPREFTFRSAALPTAAWFVAAGASGNGSSAEPFGSVQEAVDASASEPSKQLILIAAGIYDELVTISTVASLRGGLDPANGWAPLPTDSTVILGGEVEGHGVGLVVKNVTGTVRVKNLVIRAPDATAPGCGSYGMICANVDTVEAADCRIIASNAGDGSAGIAGSADSSPGGEGGSGGEGATVWGNEAGPGQAGKCTDGSIGGSGGEPYYGGYPGADGISGTPGIGGSGVVVATINALPIIEGRDGFAGTAGTGGCGGGGGGGGGTIWEHSNITGEWWEVDGCPGFHGDQGGGGGGGGFGGMAGGCSVGIVAVNTGVKLGSSRVTVGQGGTGGAGGAGAAGSVSPAYGFYDCYPVYGFGPSGGRGGHGGSGGHAGGGVGGWSIGVAVGNGASLCGDKPRITIGTPGAGGASPGLPGANGQALPVYLVP